jgi:hypothetical protein
VWPPRGLIDENFPQAEGPAAEDPEGFFLFRLGSGLQGAQSQQSDEKEKIYSTISFFITGVKEHEYLLCSRLARKTFYGCFA